MAQSGSPVPKSRDLSKSPLAKDQSPSAAVKPDKASLSKWALVKKKMGRTKGWVWLFHSVAILLEVSLLALEIRSSQDSMSPEFQKLFSDEAKQSMHVHNQSLDTVKESLVTESKILEAARSSLEQEKASLKIEEQSLELKKWDSWHAYIAACASYMDHNMSSPRCEEALKTFDKPPPYLPSDSDKSTVEPRLDKRTLVTDTVSSRLPSTLHYNSIDNPSVIYLIMAGSLFIVATAALMMTRWESLLGHKLRSMLSHRTQNSLVSSSEASSEDRPPSIAPTMLTTLNRSDKKPNTDLRRRKNAQNPRRGDIWSAAVNGDTGAVESIFEAGGCPDINVVHVNMGTVLQAAAQSGKCRTVKRLLQRGADPNVEGGDLGTALQAAAYVGAMDVVKLLITHKAELNLVAGRCGTALHAAAEQGNCEMVEFLVQNGADLTLQCGKHNTPLQAASERGHTRIVDILLRSGADPNVVCGYWGTALGAACYGNHIDTVKSLLDNNADINLHHDTDRPPVDLALIRGYAELSLYLLKSGADLPTGEGGCMTVLHVAAEHGQDCLFQFLLDKGIDLDIQDKYGQTALHYTAQNGHGGFTTLLLTKGANVSVRDTSGAQPLFVAARGGHAEIVGALLAVGAEVDARDNLGRTALHNTRVGKNGYPLHGTLLKYKADVNARANDGKTPLHEAATSNSMKLVEILLEWGADPSLQDNEGSIPLTYAIQSGNDEIALLLLQQPNFDALAPGAEAIQENLVRGKAALMKSMLGLHLGTSAQCGIYGKSAQAAACFANVELVKLLLVERKASFGRENSEYGENSQDARFYRYIVEILNTLLAESVDAGRLSGALKAVQSSKAQMSLSRDDSSHALEEDHDILNASSILGVMDHFAC